MTVTFKSKAISFWEVLIIALVVLPCIIFSISSVQNFALLEYYQIYGYPSLDELERIEGNLIELGYCTYSKGSGISTSKAKIQTENGVVSLITNCDIDKVAKRFFLKNEKIVAYKERLPSLTSPSNVVQLTVNDVEVLSYQSLIKYQTSKKLMIRIINFVTLLFWIAAFWWGWRYYKKNF